MRNDHIIALGKLVGSLQSLECLLRVYLLAIAQTSGAKVGPDYWSLKVGDTVAVDEFTNYDTLQKLVEKFNADVRPRDPSVTIDPKIVEIRDLLAHGRVASAKSDLTDMKIVKFDQPSQGTVRVVACSTIDDAWFDAGVKLACELTMKVNDAYQRFAV
jgi:hypothetical protein